MINEKASLELLVDGAAKNCTLQLNIAPLSIYNRQYVVMTIFDIHLLVDYFLAMYEDMDTKNKIDISPQTLEIFTSYHWPGNVREL